MTTKATTGGNLLAARRPTGEVGTLRRVADADALEGYLDDAAHYPGGHTQALCFPSNEAEVAALLAEGRPVLAIGVQSSLTGGATPRGETLLSTARLGAVEWSGPDRVSVGAGVVLAELETALRDRDCYYPPVPTFDGATVGGTVATNAAGASTFKYGSTRAWVRALTVVLANGDVLDIERGRTVADDSGTFRILSTDGGTIVLNVPTYTMPAVAKRSAGYHAEPAMDLIDLFIGSEGTLGIVTSVELALERPRPAWFCGLVPVADDGAAFELVAAMRERSLETRGRRDARGIDVAAVEYLDARCLQLLRDDGADRRLGFPLPESAGAAVLFQAELAAGMSRAEAVAELERVDDATCDTSLVRLCRLLDGFGVFAATTPVLPGDDGRRDALFRLREAVPEAVNRRIAAAKRDVDASISKAAADVIVPFERFEESLAAYRRAFASRGLDHAVWGHISDGNLHPNALPASAEQMRAAAEAVYEIGKTAIALGGCPMSEHGVGRNPTKQRLLEALYGRDGVEQMRRLKRALDPQGLLAPGVLL